LPWEGHAGGRAAVGPRPPMAGQQRQQQAGSSQQVAGGSRSPSPVLLEKASLDGRRALEIDR
jgi:hypothetical protein